MNSRDVSRIIKYNIINNNYEFDTIPKRTEEIKKIRREGYRALLPLVENEALNVPQLELFEELADESWYEF